MIENLFIRQATIAKHKEAHLLDAREDYLCHLASEEKCQRSIQDAATVLLDIIRVMKMTELRQGDMKEITLGAERWAREELTFRPHPNCKLSARRFILVARGWLRFHSLLMQATKPTCRFDHAWEEFVREMQ